MLRLRLSLRLTGSGFGDWSTEEMARKYIERLNLFAAEFRVQSLFEPNTANRPG